METTPEKLPPYTVEQLEAIAVREASKMIESIQRYEHSYGRVEEHLQDLAGAWVLGAMEATVKINPEISGGRGYQFSSGRGYMLNRLNEIKSELSREEISLNTLIDGGGEDGEETALIDTLEDTKSENPAAILFDRLDREATTDLLDNLTGMQKAVMIARYVDGKKQYEVAEEMGLSAGRVSQIESEAQAILRKAWAA